MVYRGTVKGGVVQFEGGMAPVDGTVVRVEPIDVPGVQRSNESDPLFQMDELAVDTGIPDLASNLDHYLYGVDQGDVNE